MVTETASFIQEEVQGWLDRVHPQNDETRFRFWVAEVIFWGISIQTTKLLVEVGEVDESLDKSKDLFVSFLDEDQSCLLASSQLFC